jgi:hypothetical protein
VAYHLELRHAYARLGILLSGTNRSHFYSTNTRLKRKR